MVPHIRVEEVLGQDPGPGRGEGVAGRHRRARRAQGRAAVVLAHGPAQARGADLPRAGRPGLPPLWIPSPDSFCQVDEIPILGTGKLDLMRLKELALAKCASARRPAEELAM